ncbi:FRG domain-containing protein [Colwellia psychrerythraea]|uniref:FRG domain protein n=1 Tax=Colwellia psychrerythraea TaxID=28229 RepID=A0A099KKD9_COLPS|nr:FRG domain-containing protein [Colwellia psychrerythraea]KGJ90715.1 FRG domain protein [Colwellia psychrerythraea]
MSSNWNDFKGWVGTNINTGNKYYFRGQSDSSWKLKTSFHRSITNKNISMEKYLTSIMQDVNHQVSSFDKPVNLTDSQEFGNLLARLQHHGFPTPLLDWTLSPYIAAYFAFKGASLTPKPNEMVSVFIFDIDRWGSTFKAQSDLLIPSEFVSNFVPFVTDNPRMSRQMGVTTLTNVSDLQTFILSKRHNVGGELLWQFDMPASERSHVMKELNLMGINDMTMFPDFDGLCKHLKEVHFDNQQKILPPPPPLVPPPPPKSA